MFLRRSIAATLLVSAVAFGADYGDWIEGPTTRRVGSDRDAVAMPVPDDVHAAVGALIGWDPLAKAQVTASLFPPRRDRPARVVVLSSPGEVHVYGDVDPMGRECKIYVVPAEAPAATKSGPVVGRGSIYVEAFGSNTAALVDYEVELTATGPAERGIVPATGRVRWSSVRKADPSATQPAAR